MAANLPCRAATSTPLSAELMFSCAHHLRARAQHQTFSTSSRRPNKKRDEMWSWIHGPGRNFLNPLPNKTNYVTMYSKSGKVLDDKKGRDTNQRDTPRDDMDPESIGEDQPDVQKTDGEKESRKPFPLNPQFISQSVLSEELREEIWRRLKVDGKSVRTVSTELFVTMERVAAVFRLKEVEKRWVKEEKRLATDFALAMHSMLPTTPYHSPSSNPPPPPRHEPLNDLPVHPLTKIQLFDPVPESRHYTRADAGQAFSPALLPADARIPHPQQIVEEEDRLEGLTREERVARKERREELEVQGRRARVQRAKERETREVLVLPAGGKNRWEWRVRDVRVEAVGRDGRDPGGVGVRYGVPHEDRKKGQVKLPTRIL